MVSFCLADRTLAGKGEFGQLLDQFTAFSATGSTGTSFWTAQAHPLLTSWPIVAVYPLEQASPPAFRGRSSGLLGPVCAILAQLAVPCSLQRGLPCL